MQLSREREAPLTNHLIEESDCFGFIQSRLLRQTVLFARREVFAHRMH